MYGALDISVSGMVAQRVRMEAISANLAGAEAVRDANNEINPFRRRFVHIAAGDPTARNESGRKLGVHVSAIELDPAPPRLTWDPTHHDAYPTGHPMAGYVPKPNIDPTIEQINALEASRAYEANIAAAEATKTMMAQALRLIA